LSNLHAALDNQGPDGLTAEEIRVAALKDLDVPAEPQWQRAQMASDPDPDAKLALTMGTSKRWVKDVLGKLPAKPKGTTKKLKPTSKKKPPKKPRQM
jgi:hypothetical protein